MVVNKLAKAISVLGHPLLTLAIFTLLIAFHLYDSVKAFLISLLIIGFVVIPVTLRNYIKVRNKEYTNFDVSDRRQRESFYPFTIILLLLITIIEYFIPDTKEFFVGTCCALLMIITTAVVNFKIKSSLHTSVSIYLSVIYFNFNSNVALLLCCLTFLIAVSRLVLKRHTVIEIITGACIGLFFGVFNNTIQSSFS